jgi:hypothetical protein
MPESRRKPAKSDGIHRSSSHWLYGIRHLPVASTDIPVLGTHQPMPSAADQPVGTLSTSRHHRHIVYRAARRPSLPSSTAALFPAGCALFPRLIPHPHLHPLSHPAKLPPHVHRVFPMRIPQESQENPPAVNGAATVPTHVRVSVCLRKDRL